MVDKTALVGQTIGRYRVQQYLASGGMADVYVAFDATLQRKVAMKIMLPTLAQDARFVQRFRREAQTVAQLMHPNIVQVYDIGQTPDGRPYLAMQYIAGGSLSDVLGQLAERGKLAPTVQVLAIVRQMAAALSAAHQSGVVHRDLKPSNILIREDGAPVLVDLGIAAVATSADSTRLTQTGALIGTPYYMSPEQVLGQPLDGRSDLYSLGIVLYELLAGERPFEADSSVAVLHKQVYEQPVPIQNLRPDLKPQTRRIVRTCLQKKPADRYQTAAELAAAVDEALRAEGSRAPAAQTAVWQPHQQDTELISRKTFPRGAAQAERPRSRWALLALAPLLVVLAGVAVWALLLLPARMAGNQDPAGQGGSEIVAASSPTATATLIATAEPTVTETAAPTTAPSATSTLPPAATSTPPPTATSTAAPEPAGPVPLPGDGVVRMTTGAESEYTPILSPDQRTLLFTSNQTGDWQIYTMPATGGTWRRLTDNNVNNYHPHYSPDGTRIVFASKISGDWELYTMRPDGSDWRRVTNRPGDDYYPSFSGDGEWIIYMSLRDRSWGIYAIRPDGSDDRVIRDTGKDETYAVFAPQGRMAAVQSNERGNHDIFLVDWDGALVEQLTTSSARDANPVFSPDGRWAAFESDRSGNYEIYVVRTDGSDLRNVTNHPAQDQLPAFSPDGRWILFQSNRSGSVDIYRQPFEP